MANFTYPNRDIDKPDRLLDYLGTFWSRSFTSREQVRAYIEACGQVELQKTISLQEAADLIGRESAPIYHTEQWYELTLLESEMNATEADLLAYGDNHVTTPAVYGRQVDGYEYHYGVPKQSLTFSFPAPVGLAKGHAVFDRLRDPALCWQHGLDYYYDSQRQLLVFRHNPFETAGLTPEEIYTGSEVTDRSVRLYLFRAEFDLDYLWKHFGYILNIHRESSLAYKRLINAIFDGVVEGTASKHMSLAFAAITDTPIVLEETETVEAVVRDHRYLLIVTDQHAYRFSPDADAIVTVGQVVRRYDQLVDTVTFYEFNRGQLPDDLIAIEMPRATLAGDYHGGLAFFNKTVDLEVDTSGIFTKVSFELSGFPGDVEKFWDDFHARGVDSPPTLAQLLDQRTNKVGEPTAAALPATINPLKFLVENVLREHAFVVKVKFNQFGPDAAGVGSIRYLHDLIPPHTMMVVIVELAADTDIVTMDGPGDALEAGYDEEPLLGFGLEAGPETIDSTTLISEAPRLTYTEGHCL